MRQKPRNPSLKLTYSKPQLVPTNKYTSRSTNNIQIGPLVNLLPPIEEKKPLEGDDACVSCKQRTSMLQRLTRFLTKLCLSVLLRPLIFHVRSFMAKH